MAGIIKNICAREIFTNKSSPTVEVDVILVDGSIGRASAPRGTSRGKFEAVDVKDGDKSYFNGMGVQKAIENVNNEIADQLRGKNALDQEEIDRLLIELDGTENKSRLGANATIATSLANAKAAAKSRGIELFEQFGDGTEIPLAFIYLMFGGPAYIGVSGTCDFQEYALIALGAKSYREGYISVLKMYKKLSAILAKKRGTETPILPEFCDSVARFDSNDEALATITRLIEEEGFEPGKDFGIYLDIAGSQLFRDGMYHLEADHAVLSRDEMIDRLEDMCAKYPIISMEDCLFEDDWEGWEILTKRLGHKVQLVGDDLFVTNPERLKKGIDKGVANAIIIKPNQIGTLTETIETIKLAKSAGYGTIVSPRSEELWDPYFVHLCVGQNLGMGKTVGAYSGGEADLNELIRIEDYLGERSIYRGKDVLNRKH